MVFLFSYTACIKARFIFNNAGICYFLLCITSESCRSYWVGKTRKVVSTFTANTGIVIYTYNTGLGWEIETFQHGVEHVTCQNDTFVPDYAIYITYLIAFHTKCWSQKTMYGRNAEYFIMYAQRLVQNMHIVIYIYIYMLLCTVNAIEIYYSIFYP